eukprot:m.257025 g.257025  ORF g.257025 m.257025 type:complete len:174 (-) comp34930_c0_seq1:121-642(-)
MPTPSFASVELGPELTHELHTLAHAISATSDNFRPMERDGLHCTVMFYGALLTKGPPQTSREVLQVLADLNQIEEEHEVRVQPQVELFPPGKQNLAVAILDVPTRWRDQRLKLMRTEMDGKNAMDWVAHVTLGKFSHGKVPRNVDLPPVNIRPHRLPFRLKMHGPKLLGKRAI